MRDYEVAIIGGGPSGLSAALTLARARRRAVVLDAGVPRSSSSPGIYGYLSRDGILPNELRGVAKAEVRAYGSIDFLNLTASALSRSGQGGSFLVEAGESMRIRASFIVLATGMLDLLPDIENLAEHWGRNVIHCEFCHGWENADRRWGVVVRRAADLESVAGLVNWTNDVTLFVAPGAGDAELRNESLVRSNVSVVRGNVGRLHAASTGQLEAVELRDGRMFPCNTLLLRPDQKQSRIVREVGPDLDREGRVVVNQCYETTVTGIFAGGDIIPGPQTALAAAGNGAAIGRKLAIQLGSGREPRARESTLAVSV